jgi:diguanylate cyclase (GGDEF)-like protein
MAGFSAAVRGFYALALRISRASSRSDIILVTVLVSMAVLTSAMIVGFLVWSADKDADRLAAISISGAIDRERSRISNEAYINAHWNDAFSHAYGSMRDPWIASQWGTPIGTAYVIDARGHTLFAHVPKGPSPSLAELIGSPTLRALLARVPPDEAAVRRRGDATVLVGRAGGERALIAFSPIVREEGPALLNRQSYRIFVDIRTLDGKLLKEWSKGFSLRDLQWVDGQQTSDDTASTIVQDWSGSHVGSIAFKRPTPGSVALRKIMPAMWLGIVFFLAVAILIARRIRGLNRELVVQSQTAAESARQEQVARLLAESDGLTGLFNRRRFIADLENAAMPANVGLMTVGVIDLDRFKPVNDTFGHSFGDRLLIEVAHRLRDAAPNNATLYRIGGDEFAMIIKLDAKTAFHLAERMCAVVAVPVDILGEQVNVGASIGLYAFDDPVLSHAEITERADQALYQAKRERPGHAVQFNKTRAISLRRCLVPASGGSDRR